MKKLLLLLLLVLLLPVCALAETARDIAPECVITSDGNKDQVKNILDGKYNTKFVFLRNERSYLDIKAPDGEMIFGLYINWAERLGDFSVRAQNDAGEWEIIAQPQERFYNRYIALDGGYSQVRITPEKGNKQALAIACLRVYTQGELPEDVQTWVPFEGKADLMLYSAHPDDELLWFGGALPYYAGQLHKKVLVVYMANTASRRKNELLDGLWHCGVREYPIMGIHKDVFSYIYSDVMNEWGGETSLEYSIAAQLRQYRPDVVLTHDNAGEYGHGAHKATSIAVRGAMKYAADPNWKNKSAPETPWQVHKLYLHLWSKQQIEMDWNVPLSAFDGKTGLEIAAEAFKMHISQQKTPYAVENHGKYDCSLFGLFYTDVGEDVDKNDFFENIPQADTL